MKKSIVFILMLLLIGCEKDIDIFPVTEDEGVMLESRNPYPEIIDLPVGFQPEGIAIGSQQHYFVGSLATGAIYQGDLKTGEGSIFFTPSLPIPPQAVGMAIDKRSGYLYVANGFFGTATIYDSKASEPSERMVAVVPLAIPFTALINDVIVTQNAVFFTNSLAPVLYKIPLGPAGQLTIDPEVIPISLSGDFSMEPSPYFPGLGAFANGIDATPAGDKLVLANTDRGEVYVVNSINGEATKIDLGMVILPFADGILLDGKTLYVVQNVLNKIAVVELSDDLLSGVVVDEITAEEFPLGVPSTIDEFGNHLYAVNAHFDIAPPPGPHPFQPYEIVKLSKYDE